jgi:pimeloyl-ACP methyl ester carboxylesterase
MNEDEQKELASRLPRGKIVWVQQSGHYIQRDAPTLLVDTVKRVVASVRGDKQHPR